jgi:hypothetical protein
VPGLERQGAQDVELRDLQRRRFGRAGGDGGERHLDHRGSGQHRVAGEAVVGEPGLGLGVEGAAPCCGLRALAEAEQRVIARVFGEASRFHRRREPDPLAVEWGLRQGASFGRAGEARRAARIGAAREGAVGDGGEGVGRRRVAAREGGEHRGLARRAVAQRFAQVALQNGVQADLQEHARPGRGRGARRVHEAHGRAQVAPPVGRAAGLAGEDRARHRRDQRDS